MLSMFKTFLLAASLAFGQTEPGSFQSSQFCGLNDTDSAAVIPDCAAQDAIDVEANLEGTALLKRRGYEKLATLTIASSPVTGATRFIADNGDDIVVACHDIFCAKSTNRGAFVLFLTTASAAVRMWSWVAVDGDAYGANDKRDEIAFYNGTTLLYPDSIPRGKLLELVRDRLVVSNFSAAPNRVCYSVSGDFDNHTTGIESSDAWCDDLGAPGQEIRGLKTWRGDLLVFTDKSLTLCAIGDQYTTECRILSDYIGVADNSSIVQAENAIFFKGSDQAYWRFGEEGLEQISKKIKGFLATQVSGQTRSNTQSNQEDWTAGSTIAGGARSATDVLTVSGAVIASSNVRVDTSSSDFSGGTQSSTTITDVVGSVTISTKDNMANGGFEESIATGWRCVIISSQPASGSPPFGAFCGVLASTDTIQTGSGGAPESFGATAGTFSAHVIANSGAGSACAEPYGSVPQGYSIIGVDGSTKVALTSINSGANQSCSNAQEYSITPTGYFGSNVYLRFHSCQDNVNHLELWSSSFTAGSQIRFKAASRGLTYQRGPNCIDSVVNVAYYTGATFTSRVFDTGFSTPIGGPFSSTFTVYSGSSSVFFDIRDSADGTSFGSWTATSDTLRIPFVKRYWQWRARMHNVGMSTTTPQIDSVSLPAVTTGQYVSACITPASSISSWGILDCAQTLGGVGAHTFYTRSAANCTDVSSGVWTSQSNVGNIPIGTNVAFQFRFDPFVGSSTDTARIDACTTNWNEGTPAKPVWGVYDSIRNAVYWTPTIGTVTYQNRLLKYDLNLKAFFPLSVGAGAMLFYDQLIYFGGSSIGSWNRYAGDGIYSDSGQAYTARWKSKDISGGSPFREKTWQKMSLVSKNEQTGNLGIDWATEYVSSGSYSVSLSTASQYPYIRSNYNLPARSPTHFFNVQFSNAVLGQPFEILGWRLDFVMHPWRVLGQ